MKKLFKSKLEFVLLISVGILIFLMVIFFDDVIVGITLFVYSQMVPNNVVFSPGIDLKQYDSSVILNCLHGGGCPEGIVRTNDNTGEIEPSEIVPKMQQPVPDYSPESQGFPIPVKTQIFNADIVVYFVYGLILLVLILTVVILLKRRKNKPKTN